MWFSWLLVWWEFFYCYLGYVVYWIRRLSKFLNFIRKSHCSGSTHRSWPTFVGCGSWQQFNFYRICGAVLVWYLYLMLLWLPLIPAGAPCVGGRSFSRPGLLVSLTHRDTEHFMGQVLIMVGSLLLLPLAMPCLLVREGSQIWHARRMLPDLGNLLCRFPFAGVSSCIVSLDEEVESQAQQERMAVTLAACYWRLGGFWFVPPLVLLGFLVLSLGLFFDLWKKWTNLGSRLGIVKCWIFFFYCVKGFREKGSHDTLNYFVPPILEFQTSLFFSFHLSEFSFNSLLYYFQGL